MIQCAIVPVAGLGTRLIPATKSQPKEMLPVARKPIVQYVAEELVANSIEEILFVTGRNKTSIEDHFDPDPELMRLLQERDHKSLIEELRFQELQAHFYYTRQKSQCGLGDAVLCGESFAGERPFAVALGDSILGLNGSSRSLSRMAEIFSTRHASCVLAVEEVPKDQAAHYGIVQPADGDGQCFRVKTVIEKPRPEEAPSSLAIAGRYIFSPVIFDMIRKVQPDSRGEIQLTDAIRGLCEEGKRVLAFRLPPSERRYDIGNFSSYFQTFVEFALADPVYGEELRQYLLHLLQPR
ncbi:MAG: UTP--glucose-1-phosphate uridylyltransferase [Bryobacteraceae bacterium]|nr:UTP--glucose-1-phosphate uridylyltransferase [Bryobacteraceae bacterium]